MNKGTVGEITGVLVWAASAVSVTGYTFKAYKQSYQQFPSPGGGFGGLGPSLGTGSQAPTSPFKTWLGAGSKPFSDAPFAKAPRALFSALDKALLAGNVNAARSAINALDAWSKKHPRDGDQVTAYMKWSKIAQRPGPAKILAQLAPLKPAGSAPPAP